LISINAAMSCCVHKRTVDAAVNETPQETVSPSSKLAERLRAHARFCRQIARRSWNEETAAELEKLAAECDLAAANAPPTVEQSGPLH
jgi:hypothetical protein